MRTKCKVNPLLMAIRRFIARRCRSWQERRWRELLRYALIDRPLTCRERKGFIRAHLSLGSQGRSTTEELRVRPTYEDRLRRRLLAEEIICEIAAR